MLLSALGLDGHEADGDYRSTSTSPATVVRPRPTRTHGGWWNTNRRQGCFCPAGIDLVLAGRKGTHPPLKRASESDFGSYNAFTSETATATLPPANRQTETFDLVSDLEAPNAAPLTRGQRI